MVQPAPKWITGCGQAFPLQMDNRKKAANLTMGWARAVTSGLGENYAATGGVKQQSISHGKRVLAEK